mmetsp:Transcript_8974/g.20739  ORF Transcript_8974/g.20739 Transcript_8974/m.20739 type:complete len:228 (-) Transcript_8974:993-1676(-)
MFLTRTRLCRNEWSPFSYTRSHKVRLGRQPHTPTETWRAVILRTILVERRTGYAALTTGSCLLLPAVRNLGSSEVCWFTVNQHLYFLCRWQPRCFNHAGVLLDPKNIPHYRLPWLARPSLFGYFAGRFLVHLFENGAEVLIGNIEFSVFFCCSKDLFALFNDREFHTRLLGHFCGQGHIFVRMFERKVGRMITLHHFGSLEIVHGALDGALSDDFNHFRWIQPDGFT